MLNCSSFHSIFLWIHFEVKDPGNIWTYLILLLNFMQPGVSKFKVWIPLHSLSSVYRCVPFSHGFPICWFSISVHIFTSLFAAYEEDAFARSNKLLTRMIQNKNEQFLVLRIDGGERLLEFCPLTVQELKSGKTRSLKLSLFVQLSKWLERWCSTEFKQPNNQTFL